MPPVAPMWESLPRGRDGAVTVARWHEPPGITPARAGRSPRRHPSRRLPRNHSRAGGTEAWTRLPAEVTRESLPRGRDGGHTGPGRLTHHGITPARAGRSRPRPARTPRAWNHSRAGGTEPRLHWPTRAHGESLPRGRDGAGDGEAHRLRRGITPARAGRRPCGRCSGTGPGNHSRAGGTEGHRTHLGRGEQESLPRGRDGALGHCAGRHAGGITPARAGRSGQGLPEDGRAGNHSRAGGTELTAHGDATTPEESLPRGRDGDRAPHRHDDRSGITPARAGRRRRRARHRRQAGNHSRAGGTESLDLGGRRTLLESLPRGRDGGGRRCGRGALVGITPARAGRSDPEADDHPEDWNHSRAGGTEVGLCALGRDVQESLPRGRDGVHRRAHHGRARGITPARAGRSTSPRRPSGCTWNHSRAGGTEFSTLRSPIVEEESLPRGRDGVLPVPHRARVMGITPARAGRSVCHRASALERRESLPRGRDGAGLELGQDVGDGITPARAGRSRPRVARPRPEGNHSRAGGTEARSMRWLPSPSESLPRGRDGDRGCCRGS